MMKFNKTICIGPLFGKKILLIHFHELKYKTKPNRSIIKKFYKMNYPIVNPPGLIRCRIETLQSSTQKFDTSQNHGPMLACN